MPAASLQRTGAAVDQATRNRRLSARRGSPARISRRPMEPPPPDPLLPPPAVVQPMWLKVPVPGFSWPATSTVSVRSLRRRAPKPKKAGQCVYCAAREDATSPGAE